MAGDAMRFRVNGLPAPQGSKRHVGGGRMVESSRAVGPWREAVRAEAQREVYRLFKVTGPVPKSLRWFMADAVSVTVVFVLPRPKSHYSRRRLKGDGSQRGILPSAPRYPAGRPDLDKLERALLDGLVAGGVMADDAQVCSINSAKVYAANGEAPGAVIEVEAMT